jgi:Fe-S cluster biogenesis protein NfuA
MSERTEPADLKARVERMIAEQVRPVVQMDGGSIEVLDVHAGVARVRLHGTCSECPSTIMAIIMEIEHELRKQIPEVEYLEAVP